MVVLCLRAPAPAQAPHLAVGDLMKREALLREAASEYKQEEAACCAAAAGVKDDDEDQGHPHDRFFSEPSSTPWERETSTPSEPTHNAPMVVLCLPAAQPHLLAAGRPKRAAPSAAISVPQCKKARAAPVPSAATSRRRGASERAR
ncbi:hypothetical protein E2562_015903 [Oryza meyeriana var. granulata]|uniref:Uncharacterized protein n=1 Tax=Oryza meyeriana var. granulata TaxID=110450 RepID=A0A6G1CGG4_9ORYZ|nr:hypothetical protein E2562_015903 [Oryza meyeriana var. granulata]